MKAKSPLNELINFARNLTGFFFYISCLKHFFIVIVVAKPARYSGMKRVLHARSLMVCLSFFVLKVLDGQGLFMPRTGSVRVVEVDVMLTGVHPDCATITFTMEVSNLLPLMVVYVFYYTMIYWTFHAGSYSYSACVLLSETEPS